MNSYQSCYFFCGCGYDNAQIYQYFTMFLPNLAAINGHWYRYCSLYHYLFTFQQHTEFQSQNQLCLEYHLFQSVVSSASAHLKSSFTYYLLSFIAFSTSFILICITPLGLQMRQSFLASFIFSSQVGNYKTTFLYLTACPLFLYCVFLQVLSLYHILHDYSERKDYGVIQLNKSL